MAMKLLLLIVGIMAMIAIVYAAVFVPLHLTVLNFKHLKTSSNTKVELMTLLIGGFYTFVYMGLDFVLIRFDQDWDFAIRGVGYHSPILNEALPTVVVFAIVGLIGYAINKIIVKKQVSQIIRITTIGMMMVGMLIAILWIVQILRHSLVLVILPLNFLLICVNAIRGQLRLIEANTKAKSVHCGVSAMVVTVLVITTLTMFGQKPNAIVRAWTETSDWTLSTKTSIRD